MELYSLLGSYPIPTSFAASLPSIRRIDRKIEGVSSWIRALQNFTEILVRINIICDVITRNEVIKNLLEPIEYT